MVFSIITIAVVFYALPAYICYVSVKKYYSEGYEGEGLESDYKDILIIVMPILNIFGAIISLTTDFKKPVNRQERPIGQQFVPSDYWTPTPRDTKKEKDEKVGIKFNF